MDHRHFCPQCEGEFPCDDDECDIEQELCLECKLENAEADSIELTAVMYFVDKWLVGDELKESPANRANTAREKALKSITYSEERAAKAEKARDECALDASILRGLLNDAKAENAAVRIIFNETTRTIDYEKWLKLVAERDAMKKTLGGHSYCGQHGLYRGDPDKGVNCPACERYEVLKLLRGWIKASDEGDDHYIYQHTVALLEKLAN